MASSAFPHGPRAAKLVSSTRQTSSSKSMPRAPAAFGTSEGRVMPGAGVDSSRPRQPGCGGALDQPRSAGAITHETAATPAAAARGEEGAEREAAELLLGGAREPGGGGVGVV